MLIYGLIYLEFCVYLTYNLHQPRYRKRDFSVAETLPRECRRMHKETKQWIPKRRFGTYDDAFNRFIRLGKDIPLFTIYKCGHCEKYHIGHKKHLTSK